MASIRGRPCPLQPAGGNARAATGTIIADQKEGDVVVVSHGTVIALYVAGVANVEPQRLWRSLSMPSYVVLSLSGMKLLETVETVV